MNTFLIAVISIVISVAAQFSLKAGMSSPGLREALSQQFTMHTTVTMLTNRFVVGGFMLYGLGALVWLAVLARWDVSKAYPLVGLGFGLTAIVGLMIGEHVHVSRMLGVMLICAGVILVGRS
jgi:multidrug transporter EmrE-like cation transporter